MGEVEVLVGCPHRLRQPISWVTRHPCPACRELGFPGLWAIAMTVEYPRLSEAAVKRAAARRSPLTDLPKVQRPNPALASVGAAMRRLTEALKDVKGPDMTAVHAAMAQATTVDTSAIARRINEAARGATITPGPMRFETITTDEDRRQNRVRMQIEQDIRISGQVRANQPTGWPRPYISGA